MYKYKSPSNEVNNNIGRLYEVSIQSNLRLTESVNNLRVTVENLVSAETKVKDIIMAQEYLTKKYKSVAQI
ncbi:MAG: hypothetical protein AB1782_13945 [Cyanobacteriota bacterium]